MCPKILATYTSNEAIPHLMVLHTSFIIFVLGGVSINPFLHIGS